MTKKIFSFVILFLLAIVQISFLPNFFPVQAIPDLLLIIMIFLAARRGFGEVWKLAIAAGILIDIFSFYPIGVNVIAFSFVVLLTSFLAKRFLVTPVTLRFFILLVLLIVGTVVNDVVVMILMKIFLGFEGVIGNSPSVFSLEMGTKLLSNTIMFLIMYWPLRRYEKIKDFYSQRVALKSNIR